ncbi:hypothetical protein GCM10009104_02220 [Marinobacterium maritimum]|uniref:Diguanylate cyclase (GGDEF) domain-containing protein n=1 Tax=Marinobacterium maritimum TaxID=500162 RepID=A0ABN1I1H5_9GAMM
MTISAQPLAPSSIGANLLLALGYLLLGLLFMSTGLHEHIVPLWLPAGLGLAAVLRGGFGLLPGVGLGSLLVNLILPSFHQPLELGHLWSALLIASGAMLQTALGSWLLQRFGADPTRPSREQWMLRYILFSGLLVCMLNAVIGTCAVTFFNEAGGSQGMLLDMTTWWLGDSFGVILGTPLFLSLAGAFKGACQHRRWLLPVRLSGTLVAVVLINQYYLSNLSGLLQQSFAQDVQLVDARIQAIIQQNLRDLSRLAQALNKELPLTRHDFKQQVTPLLANNQALRAYSWDPLVVRDQRSEFERWTREQLQWSSYSIYGESPETEKIMIPVQYVEPMEANRAALGFNLYSLEDRKRWVELAQARGEAVVTEVLYLTQAPDEPGLLMLQPVYRLIGEELLQSQRELEGFVVGVFTVERLLENVLIGSSVQNIELRVSEAEKPPFYTTSGAGELDQESLRQAFDVQLAQQTWRVEAVAGPDYLAAHPISQAQYLQVLLVGVGCLGALLVLSMHNREQLLEARVQQQTDDLAWQARHDDLTGLPNRKGLHETLARLLRGPQIAFSLLFVDLDRFKRVNDSLGHQVGDALLQTLSKALTREMPKGVKLFRMGGDEFILLVPGGQANAEAEARRVLEVLDCSFPVAGHRLQLTASIGVSLFPDHGDNANTLIKHADTAMYRAKGRGKNRYELYSSDLTADAVNHFSLEQDLRLAMHKQQLVIHYQTQYQLGGRSLCGLEALVRWQHPEQGLLGPDRFIPLAEETQLIVPLGWQVIELVCGQLATWRNEGLAVPLVAINISPQQLLQADFIQRLNQIVAEHELDRHLLELEITESMIMQDPDFVIQQLQRLRLSGYHLALDDFGTGYSSLDRIKYLPLNRIKIDKSFIRDIGRNPKDEAVVISTIALGHSLGIEVLAEGVETAEQSAFLQRQRCDCVQGYLFGRPVPVEQLFEAESLSI